MTVLHPSKFFWIKSERAEHCVWGVPQIPFNGGTISQHLHLPSVCSARWCICHYKIGANSCLFLFFLRWVYSHPDQHPSGPLCPTPPPWLHPPADKSFVQEVRVCYMFVSQGSLCMLVYRPVFPSVVVAATIISPLESLIKVSTAISSVSWRTIYINFRCRKCVNYNWCKYFKIFKVCSLKGTFGDGMLHENCCEKVREYFVKVHKCVCVCVCASAYACACECRRLKPNCQLDEEKVPQFGEKRLQSEQTSSLCLSSSVSLERKILAIICC